LKAQSSQEPYPY